MAVTQIIYLTQAQFGVHPVVHAVQNDTGRLLKMVVRDVMLSGSPTAELYFTRSDDTHFHTNAEFESQDNSFTADISQALTQAGNTRCNLTVTDGNDKTVSSYPFLIMVHESQDGTSEAQLGYSIEEITEIIDSARGGGMSEDVKQALLNCFYHVAWVDSHGQDYVDNLEEALYPPAVLTSITAIYNQTGTIYDTDDLDDLKPDLTVMANYDNGQSVPVSTYTLSGSLVAGTSTIRVNYDTKYTTFDVTVTHMPGIISVVNNLVNATNSNSATTVSEGDSYTATISPASGYTLTGASVIITMGSTDITSSVYSNGIISIDEVTDTLTISVSAVAVTLVSISAVYTQSGTVYDTDSLDSLKDDLVVTATYSDTSTATIPSTDYTLSGTLTVDTSTVTVTYGGKTDTFTVTVTAGTRPDYQLPSAMSETGTIDYILFDQDQDYTIEITVTTPGNGGTVSINSRYGNTYYNFMTQISYANGINYTKLWNGSNNTLNSSWLDGTVAGNQKIVITHDVDGDSKGYWKQTNMKSGRESYGQGSKTLTVGETVTTNDTSFGVTITDGAVLTDFKIYKRILTNSEISDYVGWEVS